MIQKKLAVSKKLIKIPPKVKEFYRNFSKFR